MKAAHLDGGHREDLQDLLIAVGQDFGIRFEEGEFANRITLGEVCDYVAGRIPLEDDGFCTTQSAFYKLRAAIAGNGYESIVTPQTPLVNVLPRIDRISGVRKLEASLALKLPILRPPFIVEAGLSLTMLFLLIGTFAAWKLFAPWLFVSMVAYGLAWKFGKEMQIETVGDLARTLAADHYFRLRRDPATINRKEFREILITKLNQNYPRESDRVTADSRL